MTSSFSRVLILDDTGRFLCVLQGSSGKYLWNFPGGKVEEKERAIDAAIREVREELGLTLRFVHHLCTKRIQINNKKWRGYFFLAPSYEGFPQIKEPDSILDLKFFSFDEMRKEEAIHSIFSSVATKFIGEMSKIDLICFAEKLRILNGSRT